MQESWIDNLVSELKKASTQHEVDQVKSKYLGKTGLVTDELKKLKTLSTEEKKSKGASLNKLKKQIADHIHMKYTAIKDADLQKKLIISEDVTITGKAQWYGSRHPVSLALSRLKHIIEHYGFIPQEGPEIEFDEYNFDALNIPKSHPARQDHDTFYLDASRLLRTHTSPVQIRSLRTHGAPLRMYSCGRVYRSDLDATHTPMFHQLEALMVSEDANFAHLKFMVHSFLNAFFGNKVEIRFRPAYFPFTEPSAEVDIKWGDKWLEVMGCGLVHPNVLMNAGINHDKYQGYAFGCGVDRMAMLKYGISDLRSLFENNQDMLTQFKAGSV